MTSSFKKRKVQFFYDFIARTGQNLKECFRKDENFVLGVDANRALSIIDQNGCKEFFIDSTFNPNSESLELFAAMITFAGVWFPLSYLFFKPCSVALTCKTVFCPFSKRLHCANPSFRLFSFFTDNDVGQMEAIQSVLDIPPTLCVWHIKRAINLKISAFRKVDPLFIDDTTETHSLQNVSTLYNMHSVLCFGPSVSSIES